MRNKLKLIFLILSFLIGVFSGSKAFCGILLFVIFSFGVWIFTRESKFILFLLLMFVFGFSRFYFSFSFNNPRDLIFFNDLTEKVTLIGEVKDEVDIRMSRIKLTLSVDTLETELMKLSVDGKVLLDLPRYPEYSYGDRLLVNGFLASPKEDENFSYKNYLARYDVYSVMFEPHVIVLSEGHGNVVYGLIYKFKSWFSRILNKLFNEPSSSFLAGLLLGSRKGIPDFVMDDFNTTGLTHIIAISGYNITLLIIIVTFLFGFLGRRARVICAASVIVIFTVLVGASAACVRACVMGIISLLALFCGRKGDIDLLLFFAAFFMTLWNPKIFTFDTGFQLSFLATMGLVYISPFLMESKFIKWMPEYFGIRESFVMTLSAQILAMPVILLNFKRFSLISPIANVLVLPFIPLAMFFGFMAVSVYVVCAPLGIFIGFIADFFLKLIVWIAGIFAKIPFASFEVQWFSEFFFVIYYLFIFFLFFKHILRPYVSQFHKFL